MLRKFLATMLVALLGTGVSAATYDPYGVQNDVSVSTVTGGGWSVLYSGTYADNFVLNTALKKAGSKIMLAARRVGSDTFDVLAAVDSSIFLGLFTNRDETVSTNGAAWYKNGLSVGFAGAGDAIFQNSADVAGSGDFGFTTVERDRLSWHTFGTNARDILVENGWRSGSNIWLNTTTDWERLVLTTGVSAVPLPASLPLLLVGIGAIGALRRKKA